MNGTSSALGRKIRSSRLWHDKAAIGTLISLMVMLTALFALPFIVVPWMQQPFTGAFVETTLIVGTTSQPAYAPGNQTPLQVDDVILAVDGEKLHSARQFQRLIHRHAFGDQVTLTVQQPNGEIADVHVVLRHFTFRERWVYFIFFYILGLVFAFAGVWVFLFRRYDAVGRAFAVVSVSIGLALAGILDVWATYRLVPLWLLVIGQGGALLFNLALMFPRPIRLVRRTPWALGGIHALMMGLVVWNWATMYRVDTPWRYIHARQALLAADGVLALLFMGRLTYIWLRSEFPIARAQAMFILGSFVTGFGPLVVWMLLPTFGVPAHFSVWVLAPTVLFPIGLAYALLRYRAPRTDIIARRGLAYATLAVLSAAGYALIVGGINLLFGTRIRPSNPFLLGAFAFLLALGFLPVYRYVQESIDRLFARTQRSYQQRLERFGRQLVEASNVADIVRLLRTTISEMLAPSPLHLFLYDPLSGRYRAQPDASEHPTAEVSFKQDSPFMHYLAGLDSVFFFSPTDLPEALSSEQPRLNLLRAMLFVPLPGQERLAGFLALGPRAEGGYTSSEIDFLESIARQAALAIERAQTVSDLERRVEQMNTLARVAQGVNVTLHFDDLLELLYAQTTRLVPAYYFRILLWDEVSRQLRFAFVVNGEERIRQKEGRPVPEDKPLVWDVFNTRQAKRLDNYPEACRLRGGEPAMPGALAWMGVPLNAGSDTIGALVLADTSTEVLYTDAQVALVHSVADLAAGAIVKARLLEESRRRAQQLTALNQIAHELSSTLDIDALLEQILSSAVKLLKAEGGTLFLVDEETGELVFQEVLGPLAANLKGRRLSPESGLVGKAVAERRSILVSDVHRSPEWDAKVDAATGFETRSALVVPLLAQGRAVGALEVLNKADGGLFTTEDEQLLLAFAGQAAVAIQNARLYTMTDQALAARVEELSVLQRIDRELNTSLDVRRAMEVTLEWAARRTRSVAGLVGLLQEDVLTIIADRGYVHGELAHFRAVGLPLASYPAIQRAVTNREPQRVLAGDAEARFFHSEAQGQMIIPIEREERVIGLLVLESKNLAACSEESIRFLSRLADHAAVAVANAQLYAEVQRANETKSEFVSFVAHELKTPMTSIRGYTDLLIGGTVGPVNENQAHFLRIIRANVERMKRLVDDLSDISRIEAGKLELKFQKVDFSEVVSLVVSSLQQQIEAKSQHLEVHLPDDLPLVWGDKGRLEQILTNLVSNAHKYTPEGGRIDIWVEETSNRWQRKGAPRVLHVAVQDTGLGMSEEDKQKVFRKFFRSENPQARNAPGTGLGLHITKRLVELHGGHIWFESRLNEGTTFHFIVPVAE